MTGTEASISRLNANLIVPLRMIMVHDRPWENIHIKLARRHLWRLELGRLSNTSIRDFELECKWLVLMGYGCDITEEDYSWAVLF